jgi:membrane protein
MDLTRRGFRKFGLFWRALRKFNDDHGFFLSSGITFNLLICLIPMSLLLLAIGGTYLQSDREVFGQLRRYFENAVPSTDPRIMRNILRIIRDRKIVGMLGIAGLVWTSTWVFSSIRIAFDTIFQVKKRGGLWGKTIDLVMIVSAATFMIISMTLTSGMTFIQGHYFGHLLAMGPTFRFVLKYVIPFFFTFWMSFLMYKIVPNRNIRFKTALQAALFTSLLWEVAKQLFGWYVLHSEKFSMVYGSLGTIAVFFLWIYYSSAILLLGGEVAFLTEKRKG